MKKCNEYTDRIVGYDGLITVGSSHNPRITFNNNTPNNDIYDIATMAPYVGMIGGMIVGEAISMATTIVITTTTPVLGVFSIVAGFPIGALLGWHFGNQYVKNIAFKRISELREEIAKAIDTNSKIVSINPDLTDCLEIVAKRKVRKAIKKLNKENLYAPISKEQIDINETKLNSLYYEAANTKASIYNKIVVGIIKSPIIIVNTIKSAWKGIKSLFNKKAATV